MSEKDSPFKRFTLAGLGAIARGVECVEEFINSKQMDDLVEKGRELFRDGVEAGENLQQKTKQKFEEFCDTWREKNTIDLESLTAAERADLLSRLQQMAEEDAAAEEAFDCEYEGEEAPVESPEEE